ncbi:sulfur oxidation protein SoxY [Rhodoplanes serenus]|uniref:Sulfur oxidation protein SoxY n=1 Tax=Rhodoplanes serenus TaxID=200615 RepID=A0A9X4XNR6_9BRAD|nr:thiosulfate oxidation carrier protein SoxY [Rhodoplanes serenus]MTW18510.1 sulfur oxidation protein SoxY [Rhodoplanes serenus]
MGPSRATPAIDRRALLRGGVGLAGAGLATIALVPIPAAPALAAAPGEVEAAIRALIGDAGPVDGGIVLHAPEAAENGAVVPLTVVVDSPMTVADHVRAIHIVATANPTPDVATYRLGPANGRAQVTLRMRLAAKQTVVVLAEQSTGTVRRAAVVIDVKVGGCLS